MYIFKHINSASDFLTEALDHLVQCEVENNITIGVPKRFSDTLDLKNIDGTLALFDSVVVYKGDEIVGTFFVTDHGLCIGYPTQHESITQAAQFIYDIGWRFPMIDGETKTADLFQVAWQGITQRAIKSRREMIVHRLDTVQPPVVCDGNMRLSKDSEVDMLSQWFVDFTNDTHLAEQKKTSFDEAKLRMQRHHDAGQAYIWENEKGEAVSMTCITRELINAVNLSLVFTPRAHRGHGYASACVATLSQTMLDKGYKFCSLFTDAANPTSNKIYRQIGYKQILETRNIVLS